MFDQILDNAAELGDAEAAKVTAALHVVQGNLNKLEKQEAVRRLYAAYGAQGGLLNKGDFAHLIASLGSTLEAKDMPSDGDWKDARKIYRTGQIEHAKDEFVAAAKEFSDTPDFEATRRLHQAVARLTAMPSADGIMAADKAFRTLLTEAPGALVAVGGASNALKVLVDGISAKESAELGLDHYADGYQYLSNIVVDWQSKAIDKFAVAKIQDGGRLSDAERLSLVSASYRMRQMNAKAKTVFDALARNDLLVAVNCKDNLDPSTIKQIHALMEVDREFAAKTKTGSLAAGFCHAADNAGDHDSVLMSRIIKAAPLAATDHSPTLGETTLDAMVAMNSIQGNDTIAVRSVNGQGVLQIIRESTKGLVEMIKQAGGKMLGIVELNSDAMLQMSHKVFSVDGNPLETNNSAQLTTPAVCLRGANG